MDDKDDHYKRRLYKKRDNKYLSKVYLSLYGGLILGIIIHPLLGAPLCIYAVYSFFIYTNTNNE